MRLRLARSAMRALVALAWLLGSLAVYVARMEIERRMSG